jgi:hypothetical protein
MYWNFVAIYGIIKNQLTGDKLVLSKGPNRVCVSSSPEEGNRSSFRNVVLYTKSTDPVILGEYN